MKNGETLQKQLGSAISHLFQNTTLAVKGRRLMRGLKILH